MVKKQLEVCIAEMEKLQALLQSYGSPQPLENEVHSALIDLYFAYNDVEQYEI